MNFKLAFWLMAAKGQPEDSGLPVSKSAGDLSKRKMVRTPPNEDPVDLDKRRLEVQAQERACIYASALAAG